MAHLGFRVVSVNWEPDMDQEWCYAYSRNCQKKGRLICRNHQCLSRIASTALFRVKRLDFLAEDFLPDNAVLL